MKWRQKRMPSFLRGQKKRPQAVPAVFQVSVSCNSGMNSEFEVLTRFRIEDVDCVRYYCEFNICTVLES